MDRRFVGLAACGLLLLVMDSAPGADRVRGGLSAYQRLRYCTPAAQGRCSSGTTSGFGVYPGSAVYSGPRPSTGSAVYTINKWTPGPAVYSGYAVYKRTDEFQGLIRSSAADAYDRNYGYSFFGLGFGGYHHGAFGIFLGY